MQQKLFQKFLSQEAGASGKTEKESQKPPPKMKKILNIYREYLFCQVVLVHNTRSTDSRSNDT